MALHFNKRAITKETFIGIAFALILTAIVLFLLADGDSVSQTAFNNLRETLPFG